MTPAERRRVARVLREAGGLTKGVRVYDSWWPDRVGVVVSTERAGLHVKWSNGDVTRYDQSHMQFLRAMGDCE